MADIHIPCLGGMLSCTDTYVADVTKDSGGYGLKCGDVFGWITFRYEFGLEPQIGQRLRFFTDGPATFGWVRAIAIDDELFFNPYPIHPYE